MNISWTWKGLVKFFIHKQHIGEDVVSKERLKIKLQQTNRVIYQHWQPNIFHLCKYTFLNFTSKSKTLEKPQQCSTILKENAENLAN